MASVSSNLPGGSGLITRTSQLINDGEFGNSLFVEEDELTEITTDILEGLAKYELIENKQDSLTPDGTGTKYPTVDAVNQVIDGIRDDIDNVIGDKNYIHNQNSPESTWEIYHHLGKKPSVTVTDSANTVVEGQIIINDGIKVLMTFNAPFTGTAILN